MATVDLERRAEIGRQKRARTRATLIDVALQVVRQHGLEDPTIDAFIAAADVARGTFYNHFQTKEELMLAAASHVADAIDEIITPQFKGVDDPAQRISIAIRQFISAIRERPEWGWTLVRAFPNTGVGWSEGMRKGVLADIRKGRRQGRFTVASEQAAAVVGIGVLAMAIRTVLVEKTPVDFGEVIAALTLRAMGLPPEEADRVSVLP